MAAGAVSIALLAPLASADELTNRRDQLKQQISQTRTELNESSAALNAAASAVDQAQGRLDAAQFRLAQTRAQLVAAKAADAAMAVKLRRAQAELAKAKAAVKAGQAKLDAKKALAGDIVRDQYQQQTNLMPIAVLTDSRSTGDLATRMQWATTMFDTTQAKIDELIAIQAQLVAEKARQAKLEAQVAQDRAEAAAALKTTRSLEARAAQDQAFVASLLGQRQAAQSAAAADVAADKSQYAGLTRERASVEQRIAVRIAKAKAEAARRAAAQRAAAQAAAAARKAAAAKSKATRTQSRSSSAAQTRSYAARSSTPPRSSRSSSASSSSGSRSFILPVSAPITSPYGMRFHPVLRYWKLHDGTDFGAGCGAPIRAASSGRVAERYYNAGYGNRLLIDHGRVNGRYVTTAYNHAIRYTVGVGQHVNRGEVIGYVGTTGLSTGCHLHLMLYLDGSLSNPMSWF